MQPIICVRLRVGQRPHLDLMFTFYYAQRFFGFGSSNEIWNFPRRMWWEQSMYSHLEWGQWRSWVYYCHFTVFSKSAEIDLVPVSSFGLPPCLPYQQVTCGASAIFAGTPTHIFVSVITTLNIWCLVCHSNLCAMLIRGVFMCCNIAQIVVWHPL